MGFNVTVEDTAEDVKKTVERIRRMSLNEGDIIHIKLTEGASSHNANQLAQDLSDIARNYKVFFLIGDVADSLNKLTDSEMKTLGWERR
jgi:thiamine monophosphate synthase